MGFHRSFDIDKQSSKISSSDQSTKLSSFKCYLWRGIFEFDLKVLNDWKEKNIDFISKEMNY